MKTKHLLQLLCIGGLALLTVSRNAAATALPAGLYDAKDCGATNCFQIQNLNTSASARGIIGIAGTTSGTILGAGTGVFGYAPSGLGVYGTTLNGTGVRGNTDNGIGVYGSASGGNGGYFSTTGPGTAVYITSDTASGTGIVSIGVTAAWLQGNVYSTATYYSTGSQTTIQHFSDARLKKNIKPMDGGSLAQLLRLRGVTYEWKAPEEHGQEYGPRRGFIAQEVEKVFPDWVGIEPKSGMKTLNMQGLEPMLVESLRTLQTENSELRAQSSKLEERVKALESRSNVSTASLGGPVGFIGLGLMAGAFILSRRRRAAE